MALSPFVAAGMLELAHRLGILPAMRESTRAAITSGLLGYGVGTELAAANAPQVLPEPRRETERLRKALLAERARAQRAEEELRRRDYAERAQVILGQARDAHLAR